MKRIFLTLLFLWGCASPFPSELSQKMGSLLASDDWRGVFQETEDVNVLAHQLLVCGISCAKKMGQTVSDYLFKSGLVSLSEIEGHRGATLELLAALGMPLSEHLLFKEGPSSPRAILEESISNLYQPLGKEVDYGDMEMGWLLCAYAHYLPATARLTNAGGMSTSFPRMMAQIMTNNSFDKFAEAGTHELMGLACGIRKLEKEIPQFSPELAPILEWSKKFMEVKIGRYLDTLDEKGDFHLPFMTDYSVSRDLLAQGKTHSVNMAIAGHVLIIMAMHRDAQALLADSRMIKALRRLIENMQSLPGELIPLNDPAQPKAAAFQRASYAHAWEALTLIQAKLKNAGNEQKQTGGVNFIEFLLKPVDIPE